ncbi:MAG: sensor histidine kinase, partial [Limisphaerales bacterium]
YPEFQATRAHIQVQPGIPLVFANEAGLTQCFSNLLTNAVKFAKPGETPRIRIWAERVESSTRRQPDPPTGLRKFEASGFAPVPPLEPGIQNSTNPKISIRIWIEDEGIGISKVMLSRVFNMFSHGSTGHVGTGIGLALVRKVVDRMGGRAGVESEEGKGSRFWMEFAPAQRF